MNVTKEVRRLAFRTQLLSLTLAVFATSLVLLSLQYVFFPGEKSFIVLSSTVIPVMWVFFIGFLIARARQNTRHRS
ncbi:hypothetical protein UM93_05010 [Psychromicrobium lacuslunae]|uniref:Uncharacterized protein n=1 Tax=Psychromicrobium lacuslunae TaxID=1618207 RepID=A0A0D4BY45_9MICC|nr:hypothetical protein UM93_05010 [Psychromicrobium lacuslunae]